jgi:hypothetical protein
MALGECSNWCAYADVFKYISTMAAQEKPGEGTIDYKKQ